MEKFIQSIIDYRAKHNLSLAKMAKLCGVSEVTLCNIENGIQNPSRLTIAKIMRVIEGDK